LTSIQLFTLCAAAAAAIEADYIGVRICWGFSVLKHCYSQHFVFTGPTWHAYWWIWKSSTLVSHGGFQQLLFWHISNSDYFDVRLPKLNMGATEGVKALQVSLQWNSLYSRCS
jgi:hypothetical protein